MSTHGVHQRRARALLIGWLSLAVSSLAIPILHGAQSETTQHSATPTVLFLCPHGAAKSVLASAYFQREAKRRGLNVHVESAGTDPDPVVSSSVADHLRTNGYEVPVTKPRQVTPQDLAVADVVISMGCDLSKYPVRAGTLRNWDDVPGPGEDLKGADEMIRNRVVALIEELVQRRQRRP